MAYETASLITNICIAAGTIGSAGTALWLGVSANRKDRESAQARIDFENSQVLATVEWSADLPGITVVNASPSIISNARVQVHMTPTPSNQILSWHWPRDETGARPYVLAGAILELQAHIEDMANPTNAVNPQEAINAASVTLTWQDVRGRWWARAGMQPPYSTGPGYPGRDVSRFVAPPGWWTGHLTRSGRSLRKVIAESRRAIDE